MPDTIDKFKDILLKELNRSFSPDNGYSYLKNYKDIKDFIVNNREFYDDLRDNFFFSLLETIENAYKKIGEIEENKIKIIGATLNDLINKKIFPEFHKRFESTRKILHNLIIYNKHVYLTNEALLRSNDPNFGQIKIYSSHPLGINREISFENMITSGVWYSIATYLNKWTWGEHVYTRNVEALFGHTFRANDLYTKWKELHEKTLGSFSIQELNINLEVIFKNTPLSIKISGEDDIKQISFKDSVACYLFQTFFEEIFLNALKYCRKCEINGEKLGKIIVCVNIQEENNRQLLYLNVANTTNQDNLENFNKLRGPGRKFLESMVKKITKSPQKIKRYVKKSYANMEGLFAIFVLDGITIEKREVK